MTAWALGPSDKAQVLATFLCEHQQWKNLHMGELEKWLHWWDWYKGNRVDPPRERDALGKAARQEDAILKRKNEIFQKNAQK